MLLVWGKWNVSHSAVEDKQAPVMTSIQDFMPETVVYQNGSLSIAAAIEDASGIEQYSITMKSAAGTETTFAYSANHVVKLSQLIFTIPDNFAIGNYEICRIDLLDVNKNLASYAKTANGWYLNGELQNNISAVLAFQVMQSIPVEKETESAAESKPESETKSESETKGESESKPESETKGENESKSESETKGESESKSESKTEGENESQSENEIEKVPTAPRLLSIVESVGEISITPPSTYTVYMSGKDERGLKSVEITLANQNETGKSGRFSLDLKNMTSFDSASFCIPQDSLDAGIYHVSEIVLTNADGCKSYYYRNEIVKNGVRTFGTQWYLNAAVVEGMQANLTVKILGEERDIEGPKITDISGIEYMQSDTQSGRVKLLLSASDESGIASAVINFRKAGDTQSDRSAYVQMSVEKNITSLTMDIYSGMLSDGIYVIDKIVLGDIYGNASIYTAQDGIWYCSGTPINDKQTILRFIYENEVEKEPETQKSTQPSVQQDDEEDTTQRGNSVSTNRNSVSSSNGGSGSSSSQQSSEKTTSHTTTSTQADSSATQAVTSSQVTMVEEQMIQEAFENLTQNKEAVIDISKVQNVPPLAFKLLEKMESGTLVLKAGNYQWSFQRQNLTKADAVSGFFNAQIVFDKNVSNDKMDKFIADNELKMNMLKYQMKYTSQFPGKADVSLKWSTDYAGMKAYIYMMNNGVPVLHSTAQVDKEGYVTFSTEYGMTGFITVEEVVLKDNSENEALQKAIKNSEKLSNNKMMQGIMIVVGAGIAAIILCVIVILSRRKPVKKENNDTEEKEDADSTNNENDTENQ